MNPSPISYPVTPIHCSLAMYHQTKRCTIRDPSTMFNKQFVGLRHPSTPLQVPVSQYHQQPACKQSSGSISQWVCHEASQCRSSQGNSRNYRTTFVVDVIGLGTFQLCLHNTDMSKKLVIEKHRMKVKRFDPLHLISQPITGSPTT